MKKHPLWASVLAVIVVLVTIGFLIFGQVEVLIAAIPLIAILLEA